MNFYMIYITVFFKTEGFANLCIQFMKTYVLKLKCCKLVLLFSFYFNIKILVLQNVTFPQYYFLNSYLIRFCISKFKTII